MATEEEEPAAHRTDSTRIMSQADGDEGCARCARRHRREDHRQRHRPPGADSAEHGAAAAAGRGDPRSKRTRALVYANRNVYLITVPPVGGRRPTAVTGASVVPVRRLTRVGGDFIGWSGDSRVAYYSIGRSFFRYDLGIADSLVADSTARARAEASAARPDSARRDSAAAAPRPAVAYEADRVKVEITARKDKPSGTIVLRGARIITMKGDEVLPAGDIVVTNNRITGVGATGSLATPSGARVVDVSGKTILPGYVDIHAHTWVAWGVHRSQVSQFLAQLAYGVTTQRDPQTSSEDVVTYADRMETGELIGPRLYSTGPGVFSSDNIKSLDEARDVLRRYSEHFNTQTIKRYSGRPESPAWVITAARELRLDDDHRGRFQFHHEPGLMGRVPRARTFAPISPFYRDVVELERFSGITAMPTLIVSYGGPSGATTTSPVRTWTRTPGCGTSRTRRARQVEEGRVQSRRPVRVPAAPSSSGSWLKPGTRGTGLPARSEASGPTGNSGCSAPAGCVRTTRACRDAAWGGRDRAGEGHRVPRWASWPTSRCSTGIRWRSSRTATRSAL
jgi:hypothetical protein